MFRIEFLELKHKIVYGKIIVDIFAKPTNIFSYISPYIYHANRKTCNIPKGLALSLRRICVDEVTFEKYRRNNKTT